MDYIKIGETIGRIILYVVVFNIAWYLGKKVFKKET